jgi:LacI family transcriptional regulator, repressor for deo operon, udp, cdd, tsx, nupC, and nupG
VTGDFTALGGLTACRLLLSASTRPTAIFAGSDEMAIGAAQAIREAGLDVPGDISVIGIDNHELSEYFDLTTMAQPAPELGRLGARMLLDALHSETPLRPVETIVPTQLIVRGTTARVG